MGIGAWWHWLVVLLIVVLVFGTKKLRNLGGDVGGAVKDFKDAMNAGKNAADKSSDVVEAPAETTLLEAKVVEVTAEKPVAKKRAPAKKADTTKPATAKAVTDKPAKSAAKPKVAAEKKPAAKKPAAKPKAAVVKQTSTE